jgi:hypothetical protein
VLSSSNPAKITVPGNKITLGLHGQGKLSSNSFAITDVPKPDAYFSPDTNIRCHQHTGVSVVTITKNCRFTALRAGTGSVDLIATNGVWVNVPVEVADYAHPTKFATVPFPQVYALTTTLKTETTDLTAWIMKNPFTGWAKLDEDGQLTSNTTINQPGRTMMQNLLNQSPYPLTIIGAGQGGAGFSNCETIPNIGEECVELEYYAGPTAAGYHSEFEPAPHWKYIYTGPPIY